MDSVQWENTSSVPSSGYSPELRSPDQIKQHREDTGSPPSLDKQDPSPGPFACCSTGTRASDTCKCLKKSLTPGRGLGTSICLLHWEEGPSPSRGDLGCRLSDCQFCSNAPRGWRHYFGHSQSFRPTWSATPASTSHTCVPEPASEQMSSDCSSCALTCGVGVITTLHWARSGWEGSDCRPARLGGRPVSCLHDA